MCVESHWVFSRACLTSRDRYVLHRHDEAALMSMVWQGESRDDDYAFDSTDDLGQRQLSSHLFLVFSLHRRSSVLARWWHTAAADAVAVCGSRDESSER